MSKYAHNSANYHPILLELLLKRSAYHYGYVIKVLLHHSIKIPKYNMITASHAPKKLMPA